MIVDHQDGLDPKVVNFLKSRGHATHSSGPREKSVVGAIGRTEGGKLVAVADSRKAGGVAGINRSPHPHTSTPTTKSTTECTTKIKSTTTSDNHHPS